MDVAAIAATAAACFLGSFVGGLCGIGGYMLIIPVLAPFVSIQAAILTCCLSGPVLSLMLFLRYRRSCRIRSLIPMLAGAVPGSVAGVRIIAVVPGGALQLLVGLSLSGFLIWQCFGRDARGREGDALGFLAGFVSGLLGASVSVAGPPVGAYGLYAGWSRHAFLGTLGAFYFAHALLACIAQAAAGLYTEEVLLLAAWGLPACVAGTLTTFPLLNRIDVALFRKLVQGIILVAALSSFVRAWEFFC